MPHLVRLPSYDAMATDESRNATKVIIFMVIFSVLSLLAVASRIVSRWMSLAKLLVDDYLLLAAIAQMLALNILFVVAIEYGGLGKHIPNVTEEQLIFFNKSHFVAGLIMPTCYATAKLSMLWLLYSIFSYPNFQKVIRILSVVVILWWITTMLLDTFICFPINGRWDPQSKATCNYKMVEVEYFATPIPWIITDFAILIAPLPVLWKMKISRARQVTLIILFAIGIATCGVACKRYVTLLEVQDDDLTFSIVEPCVWTMVESSTTIICAALPASARALRKFLPTNYLTECIEDLEVRYYAWKHKSRNDWMSGQRDIQLVRDVPDSPPANLSTRKLDITPI